jgi:hypothetical protein
LTKLFNSGFEKVTDKSPKKKKAAYLFHAITEMDHSLDTDTCRRILESCACAANGRYSCSCPQISGVDIVKPKSHTYCLCCIGQFKFQYENALGKRIAIEIQSSPFESNGKEPCTFI